MLDHIADGPQEPDDCFRWDDWEDAHEDEITKAEMLNDMEAEDG
jgi:hypothetical protein